MSKQRGGKIARILKIAWSGSVVINQIYITVFNDTVYAVRTLALERERPRERTPGE